MIERFGKVDEEMGSKLILVGDGREVIDMGEKRGDVGVEENVVFLGKEDKVSGLYEL
ncbi:hypothetical protein [Staphylococcus pasteuri]|uniref:hypothetical protein n=1 Tax=Staphylococcus pasteuri TaxID=45972 RepID=UPI001649E9C3